MRLLPSTLPLPRRGERVGVRGAIKNVTIFYKSTTKGPYPGYGFQISSIAFI